MSASVENRTTKLDQRERAIAAMGQLAASDGYMQATVAQIAAKAGISRATYYEHFKDKQECFLAAHAALAERLAGEVEQAVRAGEGSKAAQSALGALVGFAEEEPDAFALATHEAMLAGPQGWDAREALLERMQSAIEEAWSEADEEAGLPDMPALMLLGGAIRLLGVHMRRGEREHTQLRDALLEWLTRYLAPAGTRSWSTLEPFDALCEVKPLKPAGRAAPQPLPKGRHRKPAAVVSVVQRERILHATAEVVRSRRDANVSVAEIVAAAGVSRDVFYAHFPDRNAALIGAQTLTFEQVMGVCTGAFYNSSATWPERLYETTRASAQYLLEQPALSYLSFVEPYALGPDGVKRTDDGYWAMTQFLAEGSRAAGISPQVGEAVICATMELAARYIRNDQLRDMAGLVPVIFYVAAAPFMGVEGAGEVAMGKVREAEGS
jgi:AcrR family transcriptional regulator